MTVFDWFIARVMLTPRERSSVLAGGSVSKEVEIPVVSQFEKCQLDYDLIEERVGRDGERLNGLKQ